MEKNLEDILMLARFCEHGLVPPSSDFFRGLLEFYKIEHVHLNQWYLPDLTVHTFL
jgi:hypothetical protein